jgi:hypothetical protein
MERFSQLMKLSRRATVLCLAISFALLAMGAPTNTPVTAPKIYRMNQLEEAQARAVATQKPIGWIASYPEFLRPVKNLMGASSHAATAYAIRALKDETVLVFSDAKTENHKEPGTIDGALHTPEPHYTVPGVIIVTPSLERVICEVPFTADSQERIKLYTEALKKIRDKDSWMEKDKKAK